MATRQVRLGILMSTMDGTAHQEDHDVQKDHSATVDRYPYGARADRRPGAAGVLSLERGRRHGWSAARRVTREDERGRAPRPAISAEQAVQRAQQHLPDGGQVLSVELQTRTNGMQVYAVTVRTAATTRVIPINAATGAVVP